MNKQEKKYQQIKEMYEPVVEMKDYAMHQIIQTGKKMGPWRYLMLPILFVFLFVFHFSYHLCVQLKMKEKMARAVAFAMSMILVFTSVNVTAFAVGSSDKQIKNNSQVITGFEKLPEKVAEQTLQTGAAFEDINFPEKITAQLLVQDEKTEKETETESEAGSETSSDTEKQTETEQTTDTVEGIDTENSSETGNETDTENNSDIDSQSEHTEESETEGTADSENKVSSIGKLMDGAVDILFPAIRVSAAESPNAGTQTAEISVTWELDPTVSTGKVFDTTKTGNAFVYKAILPEGYVLADNISVPTIKVTVKAPKQNDFETIVDGISFRLHAEDGILPDGAVLSVSKIEDKDTQETILDGISSELDQRETGRDTADNTASDLVESYQIGFTDSEGNEITQYEGTKKISVSVSGLSLETDRAEVYEFDDAADQPDILDSDFSAEEGSVNFAMDHNGIYSIAGIYEAEQLDTAAFSLGNSEDEYIYKVQKQASVSFSDGEDIIFIPDSVGFEGEYSIGLPNASAILTCYRSKPEKGYYNEKNVNAYVAVKKASTGFDWCPYGSLNNGFTEYNCNGGGVRNLKGAVYTFTKITQNQNVEITLQKDGEKWSGQSVAVKTESGRMVQLKEIGRTGVYKSGDVAPGTNAVYINGKDSKYTITASVDMNNPIEAYNAGGEVVYHFTNVYKETVDFNTFSVQIQLDGKNSTELNGISLNDVTTGKTVYSEATDNGAWEKWTTDGVTEFYITSKDTNTYEIYTNRGATGVQFDLATEKQMTKTVRYHTFTITTNLDGKPSAEPGTVSLRNAKNETIYTFKGTGIYKEKFLEGTECGIFVNGEDTGESISTTDKTKVLDFVRYQLAIKDDAPWHDARVELRKADGATATLLAETDTNGNVVNYEKIWTIDDYELFVNDIDTHKILSGSGEKTASLTYYTANVIAKGGPDSPIITMSNGMEQYTLDGSGENWQMAHVLLNTDEEGIERSYDVTVRNTIANEKVQISSQNKTVTLQFWKVNYYKENTLMRTSYVLDKNVMSAYGKVKITGYTFSCWSENKWSKDKPEVGVPFDFSKAITKDMTLYANFETPDIKIGLPVYTDANGTVNGVGPYYRMMNLTISGFDPGSEAIKYIFLTTTNTENIKLLSTSNITVQNGADNVSLNSQPVTIVPKQDKIAITFNKAVSMAEAQDFLREKVVVSLISKRNTSWLWR